jgi:hypothetical protein
MRAVLWGRKEQVIHGNRRGIHRHGTRHRRCHRAGMEGRITARLARSTPGRATEAAAPKAIPHLLKDLRTKQGRRPSVAATRGLRQPWPRPQQSYPFPAPPSQHCPPCGPATGPSNRPVPCWRPLPVAKALGRATAGPIAKALSPRPSATGSVAKALGRAMPLVEFPEITNHHPP